MENFEIIKPSLILAPFVKHYWFLETDDVSQTSQRIISTGNINMIFHRNSPMFSISNNTLQPLSFISGQTVQYTDLKQTGKINMLVVVFEPNGANVFFKMPMNELENQIISLDLLDDPNIKELEKRITDTVENYTCVKIIEHFLTKQLLLTKEYNYKRTQAVINAINNGESDIEKLSKISCLSYKQFKRIFKEYIGINPKDFLRIVRFQKALYVLQTNPTINFAQLAFEC